MRILIAIVNHGDKNASFLRKVVREYKSMPCRTDIIILSDVPKAFNFDAEVVTGAPTKDPWSLPFKHQEIFAKRIEDYDLFIYSEDDMLITWRNIQSFLYATKILGEREIPGFLQYELDPTGNRYYPAVHGPYHWKTGSATKLASSTFAELSNYHSACYIVNKNQLQKAIASGGYLVPPHSGRYDMLCSAATDIYTHCGLRKLICISSLSDFSVHHLPNKYVGKVGISENELNMQIEFMLSLSEGESGGQELFAPMKNIDHIRWDKLFYSNCDQELVSLVPPTTKTVLSIGCGSGATEEALVKRGLMVTGIPIDSIIAVLAAAKGIEMVAPDFNKAFQELRERRFDCIILSDTLQHLPDPHWVLSQARMLIADNGQVIITVPNVDYLGFLKAYFPYPMLRKWDYDSHLLQPIGRRFIFRLFERSGLEVTNFRYTKGRCFKKGLFSACGGRFLAPKICAVGNYQ